VGLHHAEAGGQVGAAERAGEGAEAVAIGGAEEEEVVVAGALGAAGEGQAGGVGEVDRVEAFEDDRGRLVGGAVDPDGALAALGRVVDALDQVPATARPSAAVPTPADQCQLVRRAW
jgi:hypothetical protein